MFLFNALATLRSDHLLLVETSFVVVAGVSADLLLRRRIARRASESESALSARLAEEHTNFLAAAESALDAFYIFESARGYDGEIVDFTFRYVNATAERRLGRDRGYLLGRHLCLELPVIRKEGLFDLYCEVVQTGVPATREMQVNHAVNGVQSVRHQIVKLGDGVAVTSSDMTAYLAVEEELKAVSAFKDLIFEDAPFSIIATDAAGTVTSMNAQAERLTGYSRDELVGKQSLLLLHDTEELRQRNRQSAPITLEANGEAAISGEPVPNAEALAWQPGFDLIAAEGAGGDVEAQEWTYIRRDGTRTQVSVAVRVLRSKGGTPAGTISIAQDVVRLKAEGMGNRTLRLTHDALTGLVGRELLEDRIEQAIERASRTKTLVGVYVIDLDQFKGLNDSLGHRMGDEILALTAKRLTAMLRRTDTVARIGGDEFVVVMSEMKDRAAVELCAEKLVRAITPPYAVDQGHVQVTASIGVSVFPELASNTADLLGRAEAAMHSAKQAGRNRFAVFQATMLDDVSARLSMESALRRALDRGELFVEYQPQIALPEGRVIGMEALLRWRHPQLGQVSPAHFIPMAEEMGLMPEFGAWAMQRACSEARMIQLETGRRLMVSVNLSPYQFHEGRLVETVRSALRTSGLAAEDLEIEITENTLMVNSTANLAMLQQIRELGVKLSIDDFGTGFSSFSYLLQYKVDRLKIDQSFVRQAVVDSNAASVVRTIIAMSHGLGIKVIAEGVETPDQLKFLLRRHCDEAQGYYFARPVGANRFAATVETIEAMKIDNLTFEAGSGMNAGDDRMDDLLDRDNGRVVTPLRLT